MLGTGVHKARDNDFELSVLVKAGPLTVRIHLDRFFYTRIEAVSIHVTHLNTSHFSGLHEYHHVQFMI